MKLPDIILRVTCKHRWKYISHTPVTKFYLRRQCVDCERREVPMTRNGIFYKWRKL